MTFTLMPYVILQIHVQTKSIFNHLKQRLIFASIIILPDCFFLCIKLVNAGEVCQYGILSILTKNQQLLEATEEL